MTNHLYIYKTYQEARNRFQNMLEQSGVIEASLNNLYLIKNKEKHIFSYVNTEEDKYKFLGLQVKTITYGEFINDDVKEFLECRIRQ